MHYRHRQIRGFTLVEMLVVIGIIIVLVGLLSPMVTKAWKAGERASLTASLNSISMGLEAYRQDHGDYPRVTEDVPYDKGTNEKGFNGARILCRALIGPGPDVSGNPPDIADGATGPGFRIRGTQGKVYGPYIRSEDFRLGYPKPTTVAAPPPGQWAILDKATGTPILYYPATGKPNVKLAQGFITAYTYASPPPKGRPLYNANDNVGAMPVKTFQWMMGDGRPPNPAKKIKEVPPNGMIDPGETASYEGPYILWSAGPDEVFGSTSEPLDGTDDVTNFRK